MHENHVPIIYHCSPVEKERKKTAAKKNYPARKPRR